jgi:hypothetical protein
MSVDEIPAGVVIPGKQVLARGTHAFPAVAPNPERLWRNATGCFHVHPAVLPILALLPGKMRGLSYIW